MGKYCWKYLPPLTVLTIFINSTFINYEGLSVQEDPYKRGYTLLDDGLGWSLALSSMLCIPGGWICDWLKDYRSNRISNNKSSNVGGGGGDVSTKSLVARSSDNEESGLSSKVELV